MTTNQTLRALRRVPETNDYDPKYVENLKAELVRAFMSMDKEHELEQTSWYAEWKEAKAMNDERFMIQCGPLNWELEMLEPMKFQATCHLGSDFRLQVDGSDSKQLHEHITRMTAKWLGLGQKS